MSDPKDDDIPDGTTWGAHLRALRRDLSFLVENQQRTMEHIRRLGDAMMNVRSDVLLLEMHDQSRHGEVLSILERLDHAGIPPRPMFGLEATHISGTKKDAPK